MVTEESFGNSIASFGIHLLRKTGISNTKTLLIILHQFDVQDHMKGDVVSIYINAEYYLNSGDNKYKLLFVIDDFNESKTRNIKAEINRMFYSYFDSASSQNFLENNESKLYTEQEAGNRIETLKRQYPVYNTDNYKVGVYYTLEQFLNNNPGDTLFREDDHYVKIGDSPKFYYVDKRGWRNGRISEKDFFAVYNGKRWFKSTADGSFGMDKINGDFYFKGQKKGLSGDYNSNTYVVAGGGGIIGTIIVAAVTAAVVNAAESNIKHKEPKKEKIFYLFKIDPINKVFIPAKRLQ